MNSFNHYAYGAIGDWMYQTIAGIQLVEQQPGYKQFRIAPTLTSQLSWAEGKLSTLYGDIRSYWEQDNQQFTAIELTVPVNTTAELIMPHQHIELSRFSRLNRAAEGADLTELGVLGYTSQDQLHIWKLGSGTYRFQVNES